MIKGKYVATIEIDFAVSEKEANILPFEIIKRNVREELTPEIQKMLDREFEYSGTVRVYQTYADVYVVKDGDAE